LGAMVPIATSGEVTISCPEDGRYSYNSPYPAHHLMTGVDIYPNTLSSTAAPSPVTGEILQVRRVKAPQSHEFDAPKHDTMTIIRSTQAQGRVVKILHVDTEVEEGETIHVGQALGPMIRSGCFGYQTPLHAHIEVRPQEDPIRVRGRYPIDSTIDLETLEITEELTGTVTATRRGYAQIKLHHGTPWVTADIGGTPGIIDGGIPIYGWFGAHTKTSTIGAPLKLLGKRIDTVTNARPRECVADCTEFEARLGSIPVNLFFLLLPERQSVIISTSKKRGELEVKEQADVFLTIS